MRLSSRLLLVSLVTLLLPWAGCQYLRDVETALRQGQADSLAAAARAIAAGLPARELINAVPPERFEPGGSGARDIYAHPLRHRPALDGFVDDWGVDGTAFRELAGEGLTVEYVAGTFRTWTYLFLQVTDGDVVYGGPGQSDRVRLRVGSTGANRRDFLFSTRAPGPIRSTTPSGQTASSIEANWQPTSTGYTLEMRLPSGLVGDRLGFIVTNYRRDAGSGHLGTMPSLASEPGWLIRRNPVLDRALLRGAAPGTRLRIVDGLGYVLADSGPAAALTTERNRGLLRRLVRLALGGEEGLASFPVPAQDKLDLSAFGDTEHAGSLDRRFRSTESGQVTLVAVTALDLVPPGRAVLLAQQDTEAILSATDRAATRLLFSSFLASITAVMLLLIFAAWLSWRIRRLSSAASRALTGSGEIRSSLPDARSSDELGDLSRDFSRLLAQVAEYNAYLRSLGQKLSHELRTPMAVVLTSLENLQADPGGPDANVYLIRAREGLERLQAMVSALSEATRIEQALQAADRECFDLADLVEEMFRAYSKAHADRRMELSLPGAPCRVRGAPDSIAQMLDKLFENALDFCPPNGLIRLHLDRKDHMVALRVSNTGSRLPEELGERLFESLVSARSGDAEAPHLGLGMYIARIIARHHGGQISARNLPQDNGVEFSVELPLESPEPD